MQMLLTLTHTPSTVIYVPNSYRITHGKILVLYCTYHTECETFTHLTPHLPLIVYVQTEPVGVLYCVNKSSSGEAVPRM